MGISVWHWLIYLVIELLWVVPIWRLFKRVGWNPVWALLGFIPPLWLVLIWVLAFSTWRIADSGKEPMFEERA